MIAIYSSNNDFNIFLRKALSKLGIITFSFDITQVEILKAIKFKNFIVHLDKSSRLDAENVCKALSDKIPSSNISVAYSIDLESHSRYSEIDGIDKQIALPCSESVLSQLILKYFSFETDFGVLKFEQRSSKSTLLGYPLSLSKTDRTIVKLLILSGTDPIDPSVFFKLFGIKPNCLSTHIYTVNKKACSLTGRKLIIHTPQGYILNPYM